MTKIRVGVLRGGPSNEYDVSLATGANVLSALRDKLAEKYTAIDVLVDKSGKWHVDGIELKPENAIKRFDVAFLAFHGAYGEDGKVQKFLEDNKMPFTGSGSLGSAIGMNKILSKKVFRDHGIKTPVDMAISSKDIISDSNSVAQKVFKSFSFPIVVKPATSGSSVGISIVKEFPDLEKALIEASRHSDDVILEEYIKGKESTVGVIENFRGEKIYALPPVEIRPKTGFFDFQAKYQGKSEEIVPAPFDKELTRQLCDLAKKVHEVMGLKQYSRTDFIIHERRGVYVLEVNTLPGLTNESLIPKSLRAVGSDTHELVDHLISSLVQ